MRLRSDQDKELSEKPTVFGIQKQDVKTEAVHFTGNKVIKIKMLLSGILLISFLSGNHYSFAGELKWEKYAILAFYKARSEKKKIVLFVGRDSCEKCRYMRTQVFESMKPAVKTLLENNFVLWFSDADESTEWHRTAGDLKEISLPLICIIDPDSGKIYEDRTTGIQHAPYFYSRLLKHVGKTEGLMEKGDNP